MSIEFTRIALDIYADTSIKIWTAYIDWLSELKGIIINREVANRFTQGSRNWAERGIEDNYWPPCLGINSSYDTVDTLISYNGIPLRAKLSVYRAGIYSKLSFPGVEYSKYHELEYYIPPTRVGEQGTYTPVLANSNTLTLAELKTTELKATEPLTKEQVAAEFARYYSSTSHLNVGFYLNAADNKEWVVDQLEKKLKRYNSLKLLGPASKDKLYSRYLKNRWPQILKIKGPMVVAVNKVV